MQSSVATKSPWHLPAPRSDAWGQGGSGVFAAWMLAGTISGRNRRRMPRRSSTRLLPLQTSVARRHRSCSPARRVLSWWCRFFSAISCTGRGDRRWTTRCLHAIAKRVWFVVSEGCEAEQESLWFKTGIQGVVCIAEEVSFGFGVCAVLG